MVFALQFLILTLIMPELPEVETIRRQLEKTVIGKKIIRIEIFEPKMFIGDSNEIIGKKIISAGRSAKVLQIILGGNLGLFIHFKLNGQLFLQTGKEKFDTRFTRIILHLDNGAKLLFNDSRKFAWMKAVKNYQEIKNNSIEPLQDNFTFKNFAAILTKSKKPIKLLLMDQEKIAGIGNIYANESLFSARVNPFKPANSLNPIEAKKLYKSILQILKKAIACHGSSGKDEWYRQLDGKIGCYQNHFLVYQRTGQKCPDSCKGQVMRQKQSGRSTFYCPICQK